MIGQTLAQFEITAKLGEGGMGEVYRATDTTLDREVAIKVLPQAVAQDPQRLARFEREAKVLASLNHAHIAAIYQVEQDGETRFLVMELVEGEDLKQRLARGPVDVDEALSIALQVAEALEAAHERGVVHRDLKPANVKVTPGGEVKVLDFGLAKALDPAADLESGSDARAANLSMSPTLTAQMTQAGVILGTAAYMSPEQARGKPVDKRADVWAFGVLLWELLTAHSLFEGETVTDVIAEVVKKEPDLGELPETTPRGVEELLARCLRKDPGRRLPDIGAARLILQEVLTDTLPVLRGAATEPDADVPEASRSRRGGLRVWAVTATVVAGISAGLVLLRAFEESPSPHTIRFATAAPKGWRFSVDFDEPVPSPSGDRVVFRALRDIQRGDPTASTLWIRSLESMQALPLGGTEGVWSAGPIAWSPDGGSLLFRIGSDARILDLASGTVRTLSAFPHFTNSNASWNDSGTIILSSGGASAVIYTLPVSGGEMKPLTTLNSSRGELSHHFPQFLPDGNRFLFLIGSEQTETTGLFLASLKDPEKRQKVADGWVRRHYAQGYLLFSDGLALLAQPFDVRNATLSGTPVAVVPSVETWPGFRGAGTFGVAPGGTLAYLPQVGGGGVQLAWLDRKGAIPEAVGAPGDYGQIALSPDGRNVALEIRDAEGQWDLWVMDVERGVTSRVTATPDDERDPVWSPDGRSLAYLRRGAGSATLRRKGLRTSDPETVLMDSTDEFIPESWSIDGETMMVVRRAPGDLQSIWALTEGDDPQPVVTAGFYVDEPQISPDGRWLAYVSRESDQDEVYLEPFGRDGERVRVSVAGGGQPKWSSSSRELFFVTPDGFLMAAAVGPSDRRAEVSLPEELFEIQGLEGSGYDDYAVSEDGERFLIKTRTEMTDLQLHIVSNWTGLLD